MKKLFFLLLISSCAAGKYVATKSSSSATITKKDLKMHLSIIASADMEGRETGTIGQRRAAGYIETQFKNIGLVPPAGQNGFQQYYPLHQDSLLSTSLVINGVEAVFGEDFIPQLNINPNANITAGEVVFVGYGIEDSAYNDYTNADVKGKIVVFFYGEPKKDNKYFLAGDKPYSKWTYPGLPEKLAIAKEKGAIGALQINISQAGFNTAAAERSRKTGVYYPEAADSSMLSISTISKELAKKIIGRSFDADNYISVAEASAPFTSTASSVNAKINFKLNKKQNIIEASNVIGIIPGTDKKDEYVFLTAHYDHLGKRGDRIYYGADDDGSGTVAVIEMAEAFMHAKKAGNGPRRTVVFMTVSGEEKGLWGSQYYSEHPLYPLAQTTVDLNTDMIGRVDTERMSGDTLNYVYVIGHDKLSTDLQVINERANKLSSNLVLDYKFDDPNDPNRIYFRSDHYNFARKGVPILFFYDGMLKSDYHKPTDTVDRINFDLLVRRTQMIYSTAWDIANRKDMLKRDIPLSDATR